MLMGETELSDAGRTGGGGGVGAGSRGVHLLDEQALLHQRCFDNCVHC